jgi:signal transduction histidine kinase
MKSDSSPMTARASAGRWITLAAILVLAAFVALVSARLRLSLRAQVLDREADSMHALVALQQRLAEDEWAELGVAMPADDRLAVVLQTTKLRGVVALRIYETTGLLHAALPAIEDEQLAAADWSELEEGRPLARVTLHPSVLIDWRDGGPAQREPDDGGEASMSAAAGVAGLPADAEELLEVIVPLEDPVLAEPAGAAQFLIDPTEVRAQFAAIDRSVAQQALLAMVGGGVLLAGLLSWAFARLAAAERQLRRQAEDLKRANEELLLSAKVSAIGAISAHLLHGLRNPLAGIDGFVRAGASGDGPEPTDGEAWRVAAETTRRLRAMVNETTSLIAAERIAAALSLSTDELVQGARVRVQDSARDAGVALLVGTIAEGKIEGRVASLGGLVLVNLLENAVQASSQGTEVRITAAVIENALAIDVTDRGPGLAPAVLANLFRPVVSTKPGGGGIGLALSHELARLAGGSLELVTTSAAGTTFRLTLPLEDEISRGDSATPR